MQIFLFLILIGLMHSVRSFNPQPGSGAGPAGVTLAAGFLLLSALFAGNLFKNLHLPRLTGYLMLGILVGPQVMVLVTEQMLGELRIFNGVATALIALTAGTEMDLPRMRPLFRGIAWIALFAVGGTICILSSAAFLLRGMLPFTSGLDTMQMAALAAVMGVTLASQSPAVVVALRKEMEADGPVSRTVLGVVVAADLLIIVLFALTSSIARGLLGGGNAEAITVGVLSWEVFGSMGVGVLIGILVAAFLRVFVAGGALFVVTTGFLVAEVGQRIHLDPLLVALAAGVFIRNATGHGDRLHDAIEAASLPVYVAFFAVAGASIHLDALAIVWLPAGILIVMRAAGLLGGTAVGARMAGSESMVRRYAGFGLLPQAGLALALASLFARSFPQFGDEASALVFGVVALNELIAPVLYRWAIARSGEAGKLVRGETEVAPHPGPAEALSNAEAG
ncbi:MAG: cation:proton antiporter [Bryobacteraceae bacterium]|nr:cation:proton antiporter [Bryobacteraceae bacterium]